MKIMEISTNENSKTVRIKDLNSTKVKVLYAFYFIIFTSVVLFFGGLILENSISIFNIGFLFLLVLVSLYFAAAYRMFNKIYSYEEIIIDSKTLTIKEYEFFKVQYQIFELDKIHNYRYLDIPEASEHPLHGKSIDYTGFGVQENVIRNVHGSKKLAFDYEGKVITFGEFAFSWDYEELADLIFEISNVQLIHIESSELNQ